MDTLVTHVWTIVLILLCLALNYVFLYLFSILFVMLFDFFVYVLYLNFKAEWILYRLYLLLNDLYHLLYYFGVEHPYLLCVIVLCLSFIWLVHFVYSRCIQHILNFLERRNERRCKRALVDGIVDVSDKVDRIEEKLSQLDGLYDQMNSKIDIILAALYT